MESSINLLIWAHHNQAVVPNWMDCIAQPLHPLEIEQVFQTLAKFIPKEGLSQCKRVCKTWLAICHPIIMKKAIEDEKQLSQILSGEIQITKSSVNLCCLRKYVLDGYGCHWKTLANLFNGQILRKTLKTMHLVQLEMVNLNRLPNIGLVKLFLESQQNSLKSLKLMTCWPRTCMTTQGNELRPSSEQLPSMPNLKELVISKECIWNLFTLINLVPNLTKLELPFTSGQEVFGDNFPPYYRPSLKAGSQLRTLILTRMSTKDFRRLGKLFPTLKSLQLNLCTDHHLGTIFGNFKELEMLRVCCAPNQPITDAGFLGISRKIASQLSCTSRVMFFRNFLPYIGDLKCLRKLTIGCTKEGSITARTLLYGALHLPQLEQLITIGVKFRAEVDDEFTEHGFSLYYRNEVNNTSSTTTTSTSKAHGQGQIGISAFVRGVSKETISGDMLGALMTQHFAKISFYCKPIYTSSVSVSASASPT